MGIGIQWSEGARRTALGRKILCEELGNHVESLKLAIEERVRGEQMSVGQ